MNGLIAGRTASDMPGLDIAEQKSWQNYLSAALHIYAALNRRLMEAHELPLAQVRLLRTLCNSPDGSARMGDLADALSLHPSRLTRQMRRLEGQGLVRRATSPDDRRGVIATITDTGRTVAEQAAVTYGQEVGTKFLGQLSRAQIVAMEEICRRIGEALQRPEQSAQAR